MSERRVEDLDGSFAKSERTAEKSTELPPPPAPRREEESPAAVVDVNYPDPTALSIILKDVARWSGQCFVMEPSVNAKLQIFAPRKLSRGDAYELFLASLSVVNLRAVQVGKIVKIVPTSVMVAA